MFSACLLFGSNRACSGLEGPTRRHGTRLLKDARQVLLFRPPSYERVLPVALDPTLEPGCLGCLVSTEGLKPPLHFGSNFGNGELEGVSLFFFWVFQRDAHATTCSSRRRTPVLQPGTLPRSEPLCPAVSNTQEAAARAETHPDATNGKQEAGQPPHRNAYLTPTANPTRPSQPATEPKKKNLKGREAQREERGISGCGPKKCSEKYRPAAEKRTLDAQRFKALATAFAFFWRGWGGC